MKFSVECRCPKCGRIWTDNTWKHQPRIRPWPSACPKHRPLFNNNDETCPDVTGTTIYRNTGRKKKKQNDL